jgi:CheY-like chemotaxis protein
MKSIDESIKATEQASELVQSLLSCSRREDEIRAEVRILEILDDISRLVSEELKIKGIKLDTNFQKVPDIKGSASQLQQVFLNILINAIHAVDEDGVISIKVWGDNDKIFVKFTDDGVGIKKENISKIFNPFYSTKGVWGDDGIKGTGLGLSISYNIIKSHKGDITVESKPGVGTDVTVMIPIGTADKSTRENLKFLNEFNALIVEFDQKQAEILAEIIRKLGGWPFLSNWCDEAIKKIDQLDFDYVILDTSHPDMTGFVRFIDFIKSNKPSLPVILTNQGPIKYQYKEYTRMALGIISKPFAFADVADVLMRLQHRHKETTTDKV